MNEDLIAWHGIYRLLTAVRSQTRQFTRWLRDFAIKNHIHESTLWRINKAGSVYREYEEYEKTLGKDVKQLEESSIAIESLELIGKIAGGDKKILADLIEKAERGELTRDDLRGMWHAIRAKREAIKKAEIEQILQNVNKSEKHEYGTPDAVLAKLDDGEQVKYIERRLKVDDIAVQKSMTALDVLKALNKPSWLIAMLDHESADGTDSADEAELRKTMMRGKVKTKVGVTNPMKYRCYGEFHVATGTTKRDRRVDALIVENVSNSKCITLHAIEIKIDISDLRRDKKYTEYLEFADDLYLAVPEEMYQKHDLTEDVPEAAGIITIENGVAMCRRKAQYMPGARRCETLEAIVYKEM